MRCFVSGSFADFNILGIRFFNGHRWVGIGGLAFS